MVLLILFSFALIVWGYFFKYLHVRNYSLTRPNTNLSDAPSLNGCGTSIIGGFQIKDSEMKIYYIMLTVLFMPIFPLGAIVAKREGTNSAFLGFDTKYSVYGNTNSSIIEIVSCYALRWGIVLFILSIVFYDSSSYGYSGISYWDSIWIDIRRLWENLMGSVFFWFPIGLLIVVAAFFADKFEKYYKNQGKDDEDLRNLEALAKQGDSNAQSNLGYKFFFGDGIKQNFSEGIKWFRQSAEKGNAIAQFYIGEYYYLGYGTEGCVYDEAIKWYNLCAVQQDSVAEVAQERLGECFFYGRGCQQNYEEAIKWFRKSEKYSYYYLGICYFEGKGTNVDKEKAYSYLCSSAISGNQQALSYISENGDAEGLYLLGEAYEYGESPNMDEALILYKKAASQDNAEAQYRLGHYYSDEDDYGVALDKEEAKRWYLKAANQGFIDAMHNVGCLYHNDGNYSEGIKWFRKAAEMGQSDSQDFLGVLYYEGIAVEKDYEEAIKWLTISAERGNDVSQNLLGVMYRDGEGAVSDLAKALDWFIKSANQGNCNAQVNLGEFYFDSENYMEALNWFEKAAQHKSDYWLRVDECKKIISESGKAKIININQNPIIDK